MKSVLWVVAALVVLIILVGPTPVLANGGPALQQQPRFGLHAGGLLPEQSSNLAVLAEKLRYDVADSLDSASVMATYQLHNMADQVASTRMAFVMWGYPQLRPFVKPVVRVSGETVPTTVMSAADVLSPVVESWLTGHPEVVDEFGHTGAISDDLVEQLRDRLSNLDIRSTNTDDLWGTLFYLHYRLDRSPAELIANEPSAVLSAARILAPQDYQRLLYAWVDPALVYLDPLSGEEYSPEDPAAPAWDSRAELDRLTFTVFTVSVPAEDTVEVQVNYQQEAANDPRTELPGFSTRYTPVKHFHYALKPAEYWADFGDLAVEVRVPAFTHLAAQPALHRAGRKGLRDVWVGEWQGLPADTLTISVKRATLLGIPLVAGYSWEFAVLAVLVAWWFMRHRRTKREKVKRQAPSEVSR